MPLVTAPWRIVSLMTAGGGRVVVEAGAATATAAGQQQDSSRTAAGQQLEVLFTQEQKAGWICCHHFHP